MRGPWLGRAGLGALALSLIALGTGPALAGAVTAHGSKSHKVSRVHRRSKAHSTAASDPCTSTDYSLAASVTRGTSTISLTGSGEVNFASDAATTSVTLPASFPISVLAGTTLQAELVGGTAYLAVPSAFSKFVGGASWVSISVPTNVSNLIEGAFNLLAEGCADASGVVNDFESHGGTGTSLGSSSIGGVAATGTQVTLSAAQLASSLEIPSKLLDKIPANLRQKIGSISVPVDIWANSQNQVVQISADVHPSSGTSGITDVSVSLNLTNIDEPVSITAPSGAVALSSSDLAALGKLLGGRL